MACSWQYNFSDQENFIFSIYVIFFIFDVLEPCCISLLGGLDRYDTSLYQETGMKLITLS